MIAKLPPKVIQVNPHKEMGLAPVPGGMEAQRIANVGSDGGLSQERSYQPRQSLFDGTRVLQSGATGWGDRPTGNTLFGFVALAMGLATSLSRIPFRSEYLFAWDSANYALALDQYNVAFHQPQPPGYPLYVATAWMLRLVIGDANASYVTLSIVASGLAVTMLVLVGARLFDRTTGVLGGCVLATSALFWGQGEVAYPYALLAAFSTSGAWACLEAGSDEPGARRWAIVGAIILAVGSGYRSEITPFLAPLLAWAILSHSSSWPTRFRTLITAGATGVGVITAWYVPMVIITGGWGVYQQATGGYYSYFIQSTSGLGKQLLGVLENLRALVEFTYAGLGPAILPLTLDLGARFRPTRLASEPATRFVAIWLAPPLAFYVLVHLGNPGYILTFLPPACLLVAAGTRDLVADLFATLKGPQSRVSEVVTTTAVIVTICIINAGLFLVGPGEGRLREIREVDRTIDRTVTALRNDFVPASTMLVAYDRSRQYRYYLPGYRHELLFNVAVAGKGTDTSRYWERRQTLVVPVGITAIIFPDLDQNTAEQPGMLKKQSLGDGIEWWIATVTTGDKATWGYRYASVSR